MSRRERDVLMKEVRQELSASAEDLYYIADLLYRAGDFTRAAVVAALAARIVAEATNPTRAS